VKKRKRKIETTLIHAGEPRPRFGGAISLPIFQSSTYEYSGETDYHNIKYIRLSNSPNHLVLHEKLATLENAESALVTTSGMAAITTSFLTFLSSGDHLLIQNMLYGGTHTFITKSIGKLGISFDFIDGDDPSSWGNKLRPETKVIYVETMTNPQLQIADHKSIVNFARRHKLISIIDNTFASPFNFRPPEWGFDLSCHSCTKYLNGHSDIVAGAITGRTEFITKITHKLNHLGGSLDPHACFLLHRGIKTLAVRMRYQNSSTEKIAQFLENHPAVERTIYPGLKSHPHHKRATELFDGFSGIVSFEPKGGLNAAKRFMKKINIPIEAPSLGGVETLITRPATTSHVGVPPAERKELGISDSLIRISIGIEATEDLVEDFNQALMD